RRQCASSSRSRGRRGAAGLGGGFSAGFAFLARDRLLGIVARLTLADALGVEEAHDAVRRLGAFGEPALDLLEVDLEALLVLLRQQRIEKSEPLDETTVARRPAVGHDDRSEEQTSELQSHLN